MVYMKMLQTEFEILKNFSPWGLAWVRHKGSEKNFSQCRIDGAFFLVVKHPIRDLCAKFQLVGNFVQVSVEFNLILLD